MTMKIPGLSVVLACSVLLSACSDSNSGGPNNGAEPFAELFAQGITRYLGLYSPMTSTVDGEVTAHAFGAGEGPLCLDGSTYNMATRDTGSDSLLIFLEGGGACWSEFCQATPAAGTGISTAGILDQTRANNPTRGWNQVYVPYCDGSLHAGDRDSDSDGDGTVDRFQRGLHNLSAALDVSARTFPNPSRIVLAGNSGGGFGTIFALPLVRYLYPDARIDIINDSGLGVGSPGNPDFLRLLLDDWNLQAFIPASCDNCIGEDGHLTDFLIWQLEQDETLRLSLLSYTQDTVLADVFLGIGGPAFEAALLQEMAQQEEAHPDRTRSFITSGNSHTYLQIEPDRAIDGVGLMEWLGFMLDDSEQWQSLREAP
jgi:hypothetical protein